jgi:uncharacterized protein YciI
MFIIFMRNLRPIDDVEELLPQHDEFLDHYFGDGIFICSGPQVPKVGGVIIARAESREQMEAVMCEDPLYRMGVGDFSIVEFEPSRYSQQFSSLMELPFSDFL